MKVGADSLKKLISYSQKLLWLVG